MKEQSINRRTTIRYLFAASSVLAGGLCCGDVAVAASSKQRALKAKNTAAKASIRPAKPAIRSKKVAQAGSIRSASKTASKANTLSLPSESNKTIQRRVERLSRKLDELRAQMAQEIEQAKKNDQLYVAAYLKGKRVAERFATRRIHHAGRADRLQREITRLEGELATASALLQRPAQKAPAAPTVAGKVAPELNVSQWHSVMDAT